MTELSTPPGPAFIAWFGNALTPEPSRLHRAIVRRHWANEQALDVPPGYVWQPATRGTMAGWVRPRGKPANHTNPGE